MIPVSVRRLEPYQPRSRLITLTVYEHYAFGRTRVVGELWRGTDGVWMPYVRGLGVHIRHSYRTVAAACWSQGWSLLIPVTRPCGRCEAWVCDRRCRHLATADGASIAAMAQREGS